MLAEDYLKTIFELHKVEIEAIMKENHCLGNHQCYISGLKKLCKVEPYGVDNLLECKEPNPIQCPRSKSFGNAYMCNCKIRTFIHENIGM